MSNKTCSQCNQPFTARDEDLAFYKKMEVPEPVWCPECREQLRLSFYNSRTLYYRKCSQCQVEMLSMYYPDSPLKVFCEKCFLADNWNATLFSKEIDWKKSFLTQLHALAQTVPRRTLHQLNNEQCGYNNCIAHSKNCYMCFDVGYLQNCLYCEQLGNTRDSMDCSDGNDLELGYQSVNCNHGYRVIDCLDCLHIRDCYFCYACDDCHDCVGGVNLRKKSFVWFGEQLAEVDYRARLKAAELSRYSRFQELQQKARVAWAKAIVMDMDRSPDCENVSGNYIYFSKNVHLSYYVIGADQVAYAFMSQIPPLRNCYDISFCGEGELLYDDLTVYYKQYNIKYSVEISNNCQELEYCLECDNIKHCFGCFGLKREEYCILNKKYTPKEYQKNVARLKAQMTKDGEYGKFFPPALSPFGFNETFAAVYHPLTREAAQKRGFNWQDNLPGTVSKETISLDKIPDGIAEVPNTITNEILACRECKRNYKIIKPELDFYRKLKLPLPRQCPNCRYLARRKLRNPMKLWERKCAKCNIDIKTTYAPERTEIVYCQKCYHEALN